MPELPDIHSPADLKALPQEQLPELAERIRQTLITTLAETGGHLGPNLGVVELTLALHRVFDTPKDKFVFDVAHQGYVHKMLTHRWDRIHTIRQYEGLNGFLLRTESEHDSYGAGHAGTALSAALGMAVGRDLRGSDEHVVCVAGDAAFTCGPTFEALNNAAAQTKRLIVVLNDNEWSIDRNVGALAKYFNHIATHPTYAHLHQTAAGLLEMIGGKVIRRLAGKVEESAKGFLLATNSQPSASTSVIFEEFGFRYYGPIDGHDLPLLIKTFEFLKTQNEPVLLHIITEKGRGYKPALEDPGKFHGLGKYKIETGEAIAGGTPTFSQIYARSVTDFAKADEKIVAITAAMPGGTGLSVFKKEIPERYYDVGIAEEHAALFACGLATQGLKPFLTIYSTFMQRAYDMIIHDMAIQKLPVRLCMDRGGLSGDDGPTHHGLFDIGYLRLVPNLVHMQAKDEDEFVDMLWTMAHYEGGPIAIRYPRGSGTGATPKDKPVLLEIGKAEVVESQGQVALIGLGSMFEVAEQTRQLLAARGIDAALINPRWIKPMDTAVIEQFARQCKVVCTFEDHVLHNGFGCAVIEHLNDAGIKTPVARVGWPDEFIEHGTPAILRKKHGMTAEAAVEKILALLQ
ncbi:1-deoxy-D-xylulose-5-phosphate synthase [Verrucomicrobium spinosum]|uniref:1-deoxy-D-xylulose-5-phosphate synthase n=1 Tax=Verrucomicrobium spinosum TaxID=2736 RepID=UPI0001746178|nr:1-deoxy-D-xylulose-5-phosphate synthase [Verrucomicrobium spinosum]